MADILEDLIAALAAPVPDEPPVFDGVKLLEAVLAETEAAPIRPQLAPVVRRPVKGKGLRRPQKEDTAHLYPGKISYAHLQAGSCQKLWAAVLMSGVKDLAKERIDNLKEYAIAVKRDNGAKSQHLRRIPWVGDRDFLQVCALAGFDGQAVCDQLLPKLQTIEGCEGLIERLSKKDPNGSEAAA